MPTNIRADVVGSLLRPQPLIDAAKGRQRLSEAEFTKMADAAILDAIALQEAAGLDAITDGEFRRATFNNSQQWLDGFSPIPEKRVMRWHRPDGGVDLMETPASAVTRPLSARTKPHLAEFSFLKDHAHALVKITVSAPSLHRPLWSEGYSREVYPRVEDFMYAVRDQIRAVVQDLAAAGCRYVQLDAPTLAQRPNDAALAFDAELDSSVFEGIAGVTSAIHLCRGNSAGRYLAEKPYDAIAPEIFPLLKFDRVLLEYDSPRAGGFEALSHLPESTVTVLGLITTKSGELEDAGAVEARIRDASKFVPMDRLALSPQCGFASGGDGNPISFDQQAAKLRLVSQIAHRVWNEA